MFVPVTSPPQPSARVQELACRIATLVREVMAADPSLTHADVSRALQLVRRELTSQGMGAEARIVAVVLGVLMAAGLGLTAFFIKAGQGTPAGTSPIVGLAVVILAVVAVAVMALTKR
jgi:hypothetical protein